MLWLQRQFRRVWVRLHVVTDQRVGGVSCLMQAGKRADARGLRHAGEHHHFKELTGRHGQPSPYTLDSRTPYPPNYTLTQARFPKPKTESMERLEARAVMKRLEQL